MECNPNVVAWPNIVAPPWSTMSAYKNMPDCTVDRDCSIVSVEVPGSTTQHYMAINELTGHPGGCVIRRNQAVCTKIPYF
jgi:hypothetical protein